MSEYSDTQESRSDLVAAAMAEAEGAEIKAAYTDRGTSLRVSTVSELVSKWRTEPTRSVVSTGIEALDNRIAGGFGVGLVTMVLGYTGVGKSELARQISRRCASDGIGVIHVDVELGWRQIMAREISQESGISSEMIRQPELLTRADKDQIANAEQRLSLGLSRRFIFARACPSKEELYKSIVRALREFEGVENKLIILDSAQRLAPCMPGDGPRIQMQQFMHWAQNLGDSTGAAILVIGEQKRTQEGRQPKIEDALTSGAESRSVEYVADAVIVMHPQYKLEDISSEEDDDKAEWERRVRLIVAKARDGRIGTVSSDLVFRGPCWNMDVDNPLDKKSKAIMEMMSQGGVWSANKIFQAVGGNRAAIQRKVKWLAKTGRIENVQKDAQNGKDNGYRLVSDILTGTKKMVPPPGTIR